MKKIFALLLALSLVLALAACGGNKPSGDRVSIPSPAGSQEEENPDDQEDPPDSTPDTSEPVTVDDTLTFTGDVLDLDIGETYMEERTYGLSGGKVVQCSVKGTYKTEEIAKEAETAKKNDLLADGPKYTNVTREGTTISYDYSDDMLERHVSAVKAMGAGTETKDKIIDYYVSDGFTQQ